MVDPAILEKYTDSVYGYALRRTYTRDEADELSQEISEHGLLPSEIPLQAAKILKRFE